MFYTHRLLAQTCIYRVEIFEVENRVSVIPTWIKFRPVLQGIIYVYIYIYYQKSSVLQLFHFLYPRFTKILWAVRLTIEYAKTHNYRPEDAGTFTCIATNTAGSRRVDMSLAVQGKNRSPPNIFLEFFWVVGVGGMYLGTFC